MQDDNNELVKQVQSNILEKHKKLFLDNKDPDFWNKQEEAIRQETRLLIGQEDIRAEIYVTDQLIGYKDIGPFVRDPEITDIFINNLEVYIKRNSGSKIKTGIKFNSSAEIMKILQSVVQKAGREINFSHPLVNVMLPGGMRLNAVISPNATSPAISIRKFPKKVYTAAELVQQGFINQDMQIFFENMVRAGCNIVIAGQTGSGKTTFTRHLCVYIPEGERVITIEDTFELGLEGVVALQQSPKASIKDLIENALRMDPDRIILGEFRGDEAYQILQAMDTGHFGSMTTGHANNAKMNLFQRLLRAMSGSGLSDGELAGHIVNSIDLTVYIKKFKDGKWCITEVNELIDDSGKPFFKEIYKYNRKTNRHECLNSLSPELLERLQDELGNEKLPQIKPFSGPPKAREMVAV
ncbi:MAG: CpaF family protein [Desulfocucumaceae bacterium]